ncbi:DUF2961 domain-containing protein [Tessaracoccus coleopterorum]|uniref:DUF2961 domain-containing protein n=1 Tax=Tessaracoccus coleopterorum TaxID=2714950 RepID=UPI0018D3DDD8|nr:DUF2961 domain-containing protein [Tessaracoccus coleopterorum]
MPFADGARFELTSECDELVLWFYFYIDYEAFDQLEDGIGRFHASWHRECPTDGIEQGDLTNGQFLFEGDNTTGDGNYTILETKGRGHYVGCTFNVTNLRHTEAWNWYGEGDDMIFVDGESWPPNIHGTGTEDYFNTAWCPSEPFHGPYHGITMPGGPNWSGQISMYRFHIEDPVTFSESVRVTIEHGHNNQRSDDISSVAYWYLDRIDETLTLPRSRSGCRGSPDGHHPSRAARRGHRGLTGHGMRRAAARPAGDPGRRGFVLDGVTGVTRIAQLTGPGAINDTASVLLAGADLGHMTTVGDRTWLVFGDNFGIREDDAFGGTGDVWKSNCLAWTTDDDPTDGLTFDGWILDDLDQVKEVLPENTSRTSRSGR